MAIAVTIGPSAGAFDPFAATGEPPRLRPQIQLPQVRPQVESPQAPPNQEFDSEAPPDAGKELQKSLRAQVDQANRRAGQLNLLYRYGIREGTGDFFVQVRDSRQDQVLRTIPPEFILDLRERLNAGLGVLLDQEA